MILQKPHVISLYSTNGCYSCMYIFYVCIFIYGKIQYKHVAGPPSHNDYLRCLN